MLVSQRSALHVRRILSLFIKWTLDPPTPQWKRQLHNNTRISGVQELYSPPNILMLLRSLFLSLFYPFPRTHIFSSLDSSWKHTFGLEHTNPGSHAQQRLLFNLLCSWTHSCLRIFPIRILAEVNTLRYWHITADRRRSLLPLWRNALCQSTLGNSSMVALWSIAFAHSVKMINFDEGRYMLKCGCEGVGFILLVMSRQQTGLVRLSCESN